MLLSGPLNLVSHRDLHDLAGLMTPKTMSRFQAGIMLYDIRRGYYGEQSQEALERNKVVESRLNKMYYIKSNKLKVGLQLPENYMRGLSTVIEPEWLNMSKQGFKNKMKKLATLLSLS